MRKYRLALFNRVKVLVAVSLALVFVSGCMNMWTVWNNTPPRNAVEIMDDLLQTDMELFIIVSDYLVDLRLEHGRDWLRVINHNHDRRSFDGMIFLGAHYGWQSIDDDISKAIQELFNKGFYAIQVRESYVGFLKWSTLDNGWGILYLLCSGEVAEDSSFEVVLLEALSVDNWYYYRSR